MLQGLPRFHYPSLLIHKLSYQTWTWPYTHLIHLQAAPVNIHSWDQQQYWRPEVQFSLSTDTWTAVKASTSEAGSQLPVRFRENTQLPTYRHLVLLCCILPGFELLLQDSRGVLQVLHHICTPCPGVPKGTSNTIWCLHAVQWKDPRSGWSQKPKASKHGLKTWQLPTQTSLLIVRVYFWAWFSFKWRHWKISKGSLWGRTGKT